MVGHATDTVGLAAEILGNTINISVQVTLVVSMYGGLTAVCAKDYVVIRCGVAHDRITWGSVNYFMVVVAFFQHIVVQRKVDTKWQKFRLATGKFFKKFRLAIGKFFQKFRLPFGNYSYLCNRK